MKISIFVAAVLGLYIIAADNWENFWSMFRYQTVVTKDCGQEWLLFDFKQPVPEAEGNPCFIKETVPKEPLDGNEIAFVGKLGPNVLMNMGLVYKYEIENPVRYMKALSGVARQTAARMNFEPNPSVWKSAKGFFIDHVIHEIASSPEVLQANGIGDVRQKDFEDLVRSRANSRLSVQGIRIISVMSTT